MSNATLNTTLPQHLEHAKNNLSSLIQKHPNLYLAAEQINDLFDQLFTERITINKGELWEYASVRMLFGAYSSWIYSFIMTATGLNDIGLMILRRSIEFVCYISKIKNKNDRAELWINKGDSTKNIKQFNGIFSIPTAYFSHKYKHLRPLLVWFDYASDFGTHANYASLVTKWKDSNENSFKMSFQDSGERVRISSGSSITIGSVIIEILIKDLKDNLKNVGELEEKIITMRQIVKDAALEVAKVEYDDNIPIEILKSINSNDRTALDERFENLMKKYQ